MKNKTISHVHQEVEIYKAYYKPSINLVRFAKSILGVLLFGTSTVPSTLPRTHIPAHKRLIK